MMWRHKERGAVSVGGQSSTAPVLSLGLIPSTVSHLCPEAVWVGQGSWNDLLQADCLHLDNYFTSGVMLPTSLPGSCCFFQGQTGSWFLRTPTLLRLSSSPALSHPQVWSDALRVWAHM